MISLLPLDHGEPVVCNAVPSERYVEPSVRDADSFLSKLNLKVIYLLTSKMETPDHEVADCSADKCNRMVLVKDTYKGKTPLCSKCHEETLSQSTRTEDTTSLSDILVAQATLIELHGNPNEKKDLEIAELKRQLAEAKKQPHCEPKGQCVSADGSDIIEQLQKYNAELEQRLGAHGTTIAQLREDIVDLMRSRENTTLIMSAMRDKVNMLSGDRIALRGQLEYYKQLLSDSDANLAQTFKDLE
jgi:hypothetical protein